MRYGLAVLCAGLVFLACGCGNQMMRQPSFQPLDTPRAQPAANTVPYHSAAVDWDADPIRSDALGTAVNGLADLPAVEPTLPPPNLSDDALNQPAPKSVDSLHSPLPQGGQTIVYGRTLFLNRCVQCHDPSGIGTGPVGGYLIPAPPNLTESTVQKRTDGALFWTITMGAGKMPGFAHWTTPAERWALVAYVRSLGTKGSHKVDTRSAPYPVYGSTGFEDGAGGRIHHAEEDY